MQAFGLKDAHYLTGGLLVGTADNYWDVLWPHGTNTVQAGFLTQSGIDVNPMPHQVRGKRALIYYLLLPTTMSSAQPRL